MKKFFLMVLLALVGFTTKATNEQWTVQGIPYNNPNAKRPMVEAMTMSLADETFSFDNIQVWVGEGEKRAAIVIQFNTGKENDTNALVFGYRWNGTKYGSDAILEIAKSDPRFYCLTAWGSYGYSIGGFGWDADEDGEIFLKYGDETVSLIDGNYECASEYDYDNYTAGDEDDFTQWGWFSGYWSYYISSDTPANLTYSGVGASGRELTDGCWDGWNWNNYSDDTVWKPFVAAPAAIPEGATTQFNVNGIYYTLDSYLKKTVMVSAPFEMEGKTLTSYTGDINIPATFTFEEVEYTVVGITDDAFASAQIGKVELPATVAKIGKRAFQNSKLTSINITDNIIKIGEAAFSGCAGLTEYKLPASFTSIPDELYKGTSITAVTISDKIESIGASAFASCVKIETLEISATIKTIGSSTFTGCDGLKSVKVNTIKPLAITEDAFGTATYENAKLIVPMGYTSTYAAATGWKNFKLIEEFAIPVAVGDNFFVGNVNYAITEYGETGNKVVVTYFPVESVNDNNIKAANLAGYVGDVVIPITVSYQNITFTVDGVTTQAFMGAEEMTSIKFNYALTSIPERAMFSCKKLTSVEIPATVTSIEDKAFEQCQALTSATLPQGLLSIGNRAFYNCKAMESVNIPSSVTTLGDYTFYECDKLTKIEFPESITNIPANVCYACDLLAEVKLGSKVESIGSNAFQNCAMLKSIELPNTLTTLNNNVFYGAGLESISIPEGVTVIPNNLFRNAKSLKSITMSDNVTSIGTHVFNSCTSLESIKLPSALTSLGANSFTSCSSIKTITIPEGVKTIGNYTFQKCTSLETVNLHSGITSIGTYAFDACSVLKSITLPEGITAISNYSFRNCSALETLELPETISTLGKDFIVGATNVTVYVCNATPFSWSNSFKVAEETYAPVNVVYGAKADYDAATNWSLSAITEVIPTIAVDMENKTVVSENEAVQLAVPMAYTYADVIPARFVEANNVAISDAANVVVKFRKIVEGDVAVVDAQEEYTTVEAELNEDGIYSVDLLNYVEQNTKYEYHWELTLGDNEPVVGTTDYFTTGEILTGIESIGNNANAAEYYNLQGVKVNNPEKGVYIKKQGSNVVKVVIK